LIRRYGLGGGLASEYDLNRDIVTIFPDCIAVIILSMYFLIILLTGSIILPLKAIACAGLSICASFRFLVLVIQDGCGEKFLQFDNNFRCLDQLQLIFIFVVTFGLSLDYEVFLLGRIQEIYQKTMNNTFVVAQGISTISTSGSTVTLAAASLCTAIGGFIASDILVLKQIGMGIGLTIILDATLVRCVIVPALMAVMGDWNWWAPSPLRAVVKYFDIQH
jgi:RND superfamily putative drug exporter